jgi:Domain of unknown function (DUF4293)
MIQRLQSIFLLLSGISFFSLFKAPFAMSTVPIPNLLSDLLYNIQDSPILLVLTVLGGVASVAAIFLYNNRPVQIKLTYLTTICSILLPLVAFLLIYNERTLTEKSNLIEDQIGIYLPIVSLIFSVLATKYINKDENTVRSMDRLR